MTEENQPNNESCTTSNCGCAGEKFLHIAAGVIKRTNEMVLHPTATWAKIKEEQTSISELYKNYLIYLAAVPAIAAFLGLCIVGVQIPGIGTFRSPFFGTLIGQLIAYIVMLGMTYAIASILEALAPKFGGQLDRTSAFKLVVYSATPVLAAGVFSIFPWLGALVSLAAAVYSIYLFWMGASVLSTVPADRKMGFVAVSAVATLVLALVVGFVQSKISPNPAPPPVQDMQDLEDGMKRLIQKAIEESAKEK